MAVATAAHDDDPVAKLTGETLVSFRDTEALSKLPTQPNSRLLNEWRTRGVRVSRRHLPVVLETILIGGVRYTSVEAFYRFIRATNME